jgi:hypothetical protein
MEPTPAAAEELEEDVIYVNESLDENPETDSLGFVTLCLESLTQMGLLADGLKTIRQRVTHELFTLVDRVVDTSRQRLRASNAARSREDPALPSILSLQYVDKHNLRDFAFKEGEISALKAFFIELYARLQAVVEGHKLVCTLSDTMMNRDSFERFGNQVEPFPVYEVNEIAIAVHEEVRIFNLKLKPTQFVTK